MQVKPVIVSGMNMQEDSTDYMNSKGSSRQQASLRQQVAGISIDLMQGVEGMSVKEILDLIRSNEIEINIKLGCVDDETLHKYQLIKQILNDYELLNGFKNDCYQVLSMFYIQGLSIKEIADLLEKNERTIFRCKKEGIEKLEEKLSRRAYPPRAGS